MSWEVRLGDCLEGMAALADKSVDHVICDPPYEAEAHTLQRRVKPAGWSLVSGPATREAPLDFAPLTEEVRTATASQVARLSRRWVIVFCQAEAVGAWRAALVDAGLVYKRACVWVKPGAMPQLTGDRPGMGYESIVCAHAKGRSRWNGGGRVGVYEAPRAAIESGRQQLHPTEKPLSLMEALVRDFTDPGELVLDPYAGSCTTGVACRRLGRRFLGFEKDPRYFEIGRKRLENAREQLGLAGVGA